MEIMFSELQSDDSFINLCLESLPPVNKQAVCYRFGIGCSGPMTYREIALMFGVQPQTASNRVRRGLYYLRRPGNIKLLRVSLASYNPKARSYAICKSRPPEWAMNKYHGDKEFE